MSKTAATSDHAMEVIKKAVRERPREIILSARARLLKELMNVKITVVNERPIRTKPIIANANAEYICAVKGEQAFPNGAKREVP